MESITLEHIINDPEARAYLKQADDNFAAIGYKEHGLRHAQLTANIAGNVLRFLEYPARDVELARIAGYLHDVGNAIAQRDHAQNGSIVALTILEKMRMPYPDIFPVISAIGSHEDKNMDSPTPIAAAVVLADKTDVHHTRVRPGDPALLDMHARVNYACQRAFLRVVKESRVISLELTIDTGICPVMDYFEIFLARIKYCQRASRILQSTFELYINKDKFI